jgi:hypothetical protein
LRLHAQEGVTVVSSLVVRGDSDGGRRESYLHLVIGCEGGDGGTERTASDSRFIIFQTIRDALVPTTNIVRY